jgi:hypothetical protein
LRLRSEQNTSIVTIEVLLRESDLFLSTLYANDPVPIVVCADYILAVPGQMLACHPDTGGFPIEPVHGFQVANHNITQFFFC